MLACRQLPRKGIVRESAILIGRLLGSLWFEPDEADHGRSARPFASRSRGTPGKHLLWENVLPLSHRDVESVDATGLRAWQLRTAPGDASCLERSLRRRTRQRTEYASKEKRRLSGNLSRRATKRQLSQSQPVLYHCRNRNRGLSAGDDWSRGARPKCSKRRWILVSFSVFYLLRGMVLGQYLSPCEPALEERPFPVAGHRFAALFDPISAFALHRLQDPTSPAASSPPAFSRSSVCPSA